jgi:hypothetical protein
LSEPINGHEVEAPLEELVKLRARNEYLETWNRIYRSVIALYLAHTGKVLRASREQLEDLARTAVHVKMTAEGDAVCWTETNPLPEIPMPPIRSGRLD